MTPEALTPVLADEIRSLQQRVMGMAPIRLDHHTVSGPTSLDSERS